MGQAGAIGLSPSLFPVPVLRSRRESLMGTEPQGLAVGRLGWPGRVLDMFLRPSETGEGSAGHGRSQAPLFHLSLLLGSRSPWGHPGYTEGCGAPSQHNNCGLVPGASGTRTGTQCSPLRYCCSSAGPAGGSDPWIG